MKKKKMKDIPRAAEATVKRHGKDIPTPNENGSSAVSLIILYKGDTIRE